MKQTMTKLLQDRRKVDWEQNMRVIPVNFYSERKAMLGHNKWLTKPDHVLAIMVSRSIEKEYSI